MNNTKPSFKVVDVLPFKETEVDKFQPKKAQKKSKAFAPTNRYSKYLEDDYINSDDGDLSKPLHYKKSNKLKKIFKPEPSFDESMDSSVMAYEGGGRGNRSEKSGASGDRKIADTRQDPKFTKSTL